MRKAQYAVPDRDQREGNATLVYFGVMGGTVEANIDRWKRQFPRTDGESKVESFKAGGLAITVLDISGEYASDAGSNPKPNSRMLGAIVEAPDGLHFFKFTGPRGTVDDWRDAFIEMLKKVKSKGA
jgi:hypothetical protein